jgi:hypothetical protein
MADRITHLRHERTANKASRPSKQSEYLELEPPMWKSLEEANEAKLKRVRRMGGARKQADWSTYGPMTIARRYSSPVCL